MSKMCEIKVNELPHSLVTLGRECVFCGGFIEIIGVADDRIMYEDCRQALSEMIAQHKANKDGDTE